MAVTLSAAPSIDRITVATALNAVKVTVPSNAARITVQAQSVGGRLAFSGTDGVAMSDDYLVLAADTMYELSAHLGVEPRVFYVTSSVNSGVIGIAVEQAPMVGR